jgi:hypothetical protein
MNKAESIFILQIGKIGSQTIEHSIKTLKPQFTVRRDHGLTEEYQSLLYNYVKSGKERGDVPYKTVESVMYQMEQTKFSLQLLEKAQKENTNVTIITGFRDPISFMLSSIFQNLSSLWPAYKISDDIAHKGLDMLAETCQVILRYVAEYQKIDLTAFDHQVNASIYALNRFWENEWINLHNLDFHDFHKTRDGKVFKYQRRNSRYLVYRYEDGESAIKSIIEEAIGSPVVDLNSQNLSKQKDYARLYQEFLSSFSVSEELLEFYYSRPYVKALYTNEEITNFKEKWSP